MRWEWLLPTSLIRLLDGLFCKREDLGNIETQQPSGKTAELTPYKTSLLTLLDGNQTNKQGGNNMVYKPNASMTERLCDNAYGLMLIWKQRIEHDLTEEAQKEDPMPSMWPNRALGRR